jgi:hypothetical protein
MNGVYGSGWSEDCGFWYVLIWRELSQAGGEMLIAIVGIVAIRLLMVRRVRSVVWVFVEVSRM